METYMVRTNKKTYNKVRSAMRECWQKFPTIVAMYTIRHGYTVDGRELAFQANRNPLVQVAYHEHDMWLVITDDAKLFPQLYKKIKRITRKWKYYK